MHTQSFLKNGFRSSIIRALWWLCFPVEKETWSDEKERSITNHPGVQIASKPTVSCYKRNTGSPFILYLAI